MRKWLKMSYSIDPKITITFLIDTSARKNLLTFNKEFIQNQNEGNDKECILEINAIYPKKLLKNTVIYSSY